MARMSAAAASSSSPAGRCRRQPGRAVTRPASSAGLPNAAASRLRRCWIDAYASTATGSSARPSRTAGSRNVTCRLLGLRLGGRGAARAARRHRAAPHPVGAPQVGRQVVQPVAVGGEHEMVGARAPQRRGDLGAVGRGGGLEAAAHLAPARVDDDLAPGLGVDHPHVAGRRQLQLARIAHLDREHAVARAQRAQPGLPVARAAEVRHDHHEPARAGERARAGASRRRATSRPRRRRAGSARSSASSPSSPSRPWRGRSTRGSRAAEGDHAQAVAAPRRDMADGEAHALRHVGLAPQRGAEGHRRRDVEHEPCRHRALADVHAHVRLAHPRGHVPVDVADVVARLVGADQRQLGAGRRPAASRGRPGRATGSGASRRGRASAGPRRGPGRAPDVPGVRSGWGGGHAPHGSRPFRSSPVTSPASSSASAPPANAAVTSCFSLRVASPRPRFA